MPEIKINNAQAKRISFWKETQEKINLIGLKALYLNYYQLVGSSFINRLKDILIIMLCAYLVISGQFSFGILMSISYILGQLSGPINQINTFSQSFQDAKISFERLEEIQEKEDEKSKDSLPVPILKRCIKLKNISFKYEGNFNDYVLDNISFNIPKGKITAIVGNSGSGKTTILKLLLGFYSPQKGEILVDHTILNWINVDEWRDKCGVVMQDGYIFSGTVMDNIALASHDIDIEKMKTAAEIACIDTFIESLPNKYLTKIGKSGIDLSGGQKQRILIARAVYKNPDIIMFDEATSHLDSINENIIMKNLQCFYEGKTVVIIAHRLSTVVNADNIIFLEKGKILEQGIHQELWEKKGFYYELVRNQLEIEL